LILICSQVYLDKKMTFKIDQLVQVFLEDNTCRESKILWEEDNGNYRVCWLEDIETISIIP
jgi:hypothetical protein